MGQRMELQSGFHKKNYVPGFVMKYVFIYGNGCICLSMQMRQNSAFCISVMDKSSFRDHYNLMRLVSAPISIV